MQTFIVADKAHLALAAAIAAQLQLPLYELQTTRFADSEMSVALKDDVAIPQHGHALVVHSTSNPVNENLMQLLLTLQMLKNKGVATITAVIPYFGYGRQDEKGGSESVAQFVMRLLREAGADRMVTVELHNADILQGAALPVTDIKLAGFIAEYIKMQGGPADRTVIAPDRGAQERVDAIARVLDAPMLVYDKERYAVNKTRITASDGTCMTLKGILVDDIIDTGFSLMHVADKLRGERSACRLSVFGVHAVLSGHAAMALQESAFEHIWVTNTVPWPQGILPTKYVVIDISQQIAQVLAGLI